MPPSSLTPQSCRPTTAATIRLTSDMNSWVPAQVFAAHVRWLVAQTAVPWRVIAVLSGVSSRTIARLVGVGAPIRRIRSIDATRLIGIRPEHILATTTTLVDATSTRRRIHMLCTSGCSMDHIAGFLGAHHRTVQGLANGDSTTCTLMVRLRAMAACERLQIPARINAPATGSPHVAVLPDAA